MKCKPEFTEGQRVKLLPFEEQPEQTGVVDVVEHITSEGTHYHMFIVRVDKKFITENYDDGIREVTDDQLEAL